MLQKSNGQNKCQSLPCTYVAKANGTISAKAERSIERAQRCHANDSAKVKMVLPKSMVKAAAKVKCMVIIIWPDAAEAILSSVRPK